MTVFPRTTLVQNIGHDGSGTHCNDDQDFDKENKISDKKDFKKVPFNENDYVNRIIYKKNNVTFSLRVKNKIKRMIGELRSGIES